MKYDKRGVSADKKEVHQAIEKLDKGLYPNAFCKILPDLAAGHPEFCNIMHADTAGTKSSLAYLYWKETGDLSVWEGIVQDAIVMNLDDMACCGMPESFIFSNTLARNKNNIPGEVLNALINGTDRFLGQLRDEGINAQLAGGETADVGDLVRTIDVGFTAFCRLKRADVLEVNIKPGDVVVSLASWGQATYEDSYNSGIGSNGLTFARHEMLNKDYAEKYPESFDPTLDPEVVYSGSHSLTDESGEEGMDIGRMMLSPTRTFTPFLKKLFEKRLPLSGIIHCTGGGLSKVLNFIDDLHVIKDNPLPVPPVFEMIRKESNTPLKEMYEVFNMGQRLEIYLPEADAEKVLNLAASFNIEAAISGRCEQHNGRKVTVNTSDGAIEYIR